MEIKKLIRAKHGFEKFLLFVSRIEPRKNHLLLLKTYLELKLYEKGYRLVLIGHESIKVPAFTTLLNSLDAEVRQYIFIRHTMNNEELLELYRATDLFTYPSKAEGFGIPPLEAGAARVPVLCSNTTAMSEFTFFDEGLFNPYDETEFRDTLVNALEKKYHDHYLDNISLTIRRQYSWEQPAEKLYGLMNGKQYPIEHPVEQTVYNDISR